MHFVHRVLHKRLFWRTDIETLTDIKNPPISTLMLPKTNIWNTFSYYEPRTLLMRFLNVTPMTVLTLYLLTWRIWWAPNNASKGQMGFNSSFTGINTTVYFHRHPFLFWAWTPKMKNLSLIEAHVTTIIATITRRTTKFRVRP